MKTHLAMTLAILIAAVAAPAQDLGGGRHAKAPRAWPANVPVRLRQGGDTIADAVPIAAIPFDTTGTTTGYTDDYDEICPYTQSVAPDVVYSLTPLEVMTIDVDMLGSLYDTKIYIYDADLELVACNDDWYENYVSKLVDVAIDPVHAPYFLVIDGFYQEHGEYVLAVREHEPCDLGDGCEAQENEPPLSDDYHDTFNGGCDTIVADPPLSYISTDGLFCGRAGWYQDQGADAVDTDWFSVHLDDDGVATITIDAEVETRLLRFWPADCADGYFGQLVVGGPCRPATMTLEAEPYSEVWLVVRPDDPVQPPGFPDSEYDYVLEVEGVTAYYLTLGAEDDYTFGAPLLDNPTMRVDVDAGPASQDDVDLVDRCAGPPTPGPDLLAAVYLAAGDDIEAEIYPFYYAADDPPLMRREQQLCFAVMSDLRQPDAACLGYCCTNTYNTYVIFDSPTVSGWYYLVADRREVEPIGHAWSTVWHTATAPPPAPAGDVCTDAESIAPGPVAISADLGNATDAVDPGRDGCLDAPGIHYTGRDLVYRVDFTHGQTLDVVMIGDGGWEEALYLVRDCENPIGNCVAAAQPEDEGVRLTYTALEDETLWLVCDSWGVGERPFTLTGSLDDLTDAPTPLAPAQLALRAAPNPFNPQTTIEYDLPRAAHARLRVHDLRGRLVATLVDQQQDAGRHTATWRATGPRNATLPSGTYLLRLEAAGEVRTARVTVLK